MSKPWLTATFACFCKNFQKSIQLNPNVVSHRLTLILRAILIRLFHFSTQGLCELFPILLIFIPTFKKKFGPFENILRSAREILVTRHQNLFFIWRMHFRCLELHDASAMVTPPLIREKHVRGDESTIRKPIVNDSVRIHLTSATGPVSRTAQVITAGAQTKCQGGNLGGSLKSPVRHQQLGPRLCKNSNTSDVQVSLSVSCAAYKLPIVT